MEATMELPATDDEGYLVDPADWNEALAVALARLEHIQLTDTHWDAIRFMRAYYQEHQVIPDVRFVIRYLAGRFAGASRNLIFELFPYGYVKQACKIAGMRRPRGWSTG
ncbi:MAG: sulfite reductase subunit gamma [Rhodocyclales bacterium GWA2_65_19]|nr:MAG: sulfite reductase subunit gamma [Rhodocyclales bacterium GWA2_65_19]